MVLLAQAKGAVVAFWHQARLLGEQLHQPPPPAEIHPALVEQIAVHKMMLVGHWEKKRIEVFGGTEIRAQPSAVSLGHSYPNILSFSCPCCRLRRGARLPCMP